MNFPSPEEFSKLMEEAGMTDIARYRLTLGTCHLYVGNKPCDD